MAIDEKWIPKTIHKFCKVQKLMAQLEIFSQDENEYYSNAFDRFKSFLSSNPNHGFLQK